MTKYPVLIHCRALQWASVWLYEIPWKRKTTKIRQFSRCENFREFFCHFISQEERRLIHSWYLNARLLLKSHNVLVVEQTVPGEEPIGSLMSIVPPITGLVTGDPATEPSGAGGGADSAGGRANKKPDEYCSTNHRPCYRGSCRWA